MCDWIIHDPGTGPFTIHGPFPTPRAATAWAQAKLGTDEWDYTWMTWAEIRRLVEAQEPIHRPLRREVP